MAGRQFQQFKQMTQKEQDKLGKTLWKYGAMKMKRIFLSLKKRCVEKCIM